MFKETGTMNHRMGLGLILLLAISAPSNAQDNQVPDGFRPLFNGKDLEGWKSTGKWKFGVPKRASFSVPAAGAAG